MSRARESVFREHVDCDFCHSLTVSDAIYGEEWNHEARKIAFLGCGDLPLNVRAFGKILRLPGGLFFSAHRGWAKALRPTF
jgi:hypothetical protein